MPNYLSPTDFASTREARDRIATATDEELTFALWGLAVLLGVDASRLTKADLLRHIDTMLEQESN